MNKKILRLALGLTLNILLLATCDRTPTRPTVAPERAASATPEPPATATPLPSPGAISPATVAQIESLHTSSGTSLAFSPDGALLATSSNTDHTVRLWDVESGQVMRTFSDSPSVYGMTFSPDGALLALKGGGEVRLWDVESGEIVHTFSGQGRYMMSVAFSPDGALLATGGPITR